MNSLSRFYKNLGVKKETLFAITIRHRGVIVHVFEDTPDPAKPDAIFPNNWFSCHQDGLVVIYPMLAKTRRAERRTDVVQFLKENKKVFYSTLSFLNVLDL